MITINIKHGDRVETFELEPTDPRIRFNREVTEIDKTLVKEGIQWGDAIAWVTKKIGLQQCVGCKARQEILNHVREFGITETVRQIKETFNADKK